MLDISKILSTKNSTPFLLLETKRGKDIYVQQNENGCWVVISHAYDRYGYAKISYCHEDTKVHRLVFELFNEVELPQNIIVRHLCHNKGCAKPSHLLSGTHKEGADDNLVNGTVPKKPTRLTKEQKHDIISDTKRTVAELAKDYNICIETVKNIRRKASKESKKPRVTRAGDKPAAKNERSNSKKQKQK